MICGFSFSISTYSVAYGFVAKTRDKKEAPSYEYHAYGGGLEPRQLNVPKKTNLVNLFRGCLALTHSPPIMPEAGGPLHEVAFIQALHGLGTIQGWLRGTGEQGNIASLHQSQSTAVFRHFVNVPATSDGWRTGLEVLEPCVGSLKIHRGNSPMVTINFPTQAMLPNLSPWRVTTPGRVSYGQNINCQRQVHPRNMVAGAARLGQDPPPQWVSESAACLVNDWGVAANNTWNPIASGCRDTKQCAAFHDSSPLSEPLPDRYARHHISVVKPMWVGPRKIMQQGSRKCQPWELEPRAKRESWELGLPCTQVSTWPPKRMISTWVLRSATSCLCYRRQTQNSLRSSLRNTLRILDSMKIVSVSMCFQSLRLCLTESMQPKCGTKLPLLPGTGAQVQEFAIGPEALATGVVEANLKQGSRWVKMGQDGSRWVKMGQAVQQWSSSNSVPSLARLDDCACLVSQQ